MTKIITTVSLEEDLKKQLDVYHIKLSELIDELLREYFRNYGKKTAKIEQNPTGSPCRSDQD